MMTRPEFHPFAAIFPMMAEAELQDLAADIAGRGLEQPIVRDRDGRILDGRNRLLACEMAHVEPIFEVYEGDDALAYVISLNLKRRHLSESQRAMVAAKIANLDKGANQHVGASANLRMLPGIEPNPASPPPVTQRAAADMLNVSERAVSDAKRVQRDGVPELAEAVERDEIAVSRAAEIAKAPPEEQRRVVQLPTASEARKQAKETGRYVEARDGRMYDGRSKEEVDASSTRTQIIYRAIDAMKALAGMPETPSEYLSRLPDYVRVEVAPHVAPAAQWLGDFASQWSKKNAA